jgi:hypothetical protein
MYLNAQKYKITCKLQLPFPHSHTQLKKHTYMIHTPINHTDTTQKKKKTDITTLLLLLQ